MSELAGEETRFLPLAPAFWTTPIIKHAALCGVNVQSGPTRD